MMIKKKIMFFGNHAFVIYNFRKELIKRLLHEGHEVILSMPYDKEKVPLMQSWGCKFVETKVDRRGTNLLKDISLLLHYIKILKSEKPDIVLTYTIKPNLYGGMACSFMSIPYITNITGLGSGFKEQSILKNILIFLYKFGLKNSSKVFFQNTHDQKVLKSYNIVKNSSEVIPGSGVNLKEFTMKKMPHDETATKFLFVGRIMKDKGILEYLKAAEIVKKEYKENVQFDVVGFIEPTESELSQKINTFDNEGIINYYGYQSNVKPFIENVHCLIQPSHGGEGISNVLLEAGAMGRVLIASNIPGCKETIDVGKNGFLFESKNAQDLANQMKKILKNDSLSIQQMGLNSRHKMNRTFDRNIVVNSYLEAINEEVKTRKEIKDGIL